MFLCWFLEQPNTLILKIEDCELVCSRVLIVCDIVRSLTIQSKVRYHLHFVYYALLHWIQEASGVGPYVG